MLLMVIRFISTGVAVGAFVGSPAFGVASGLGRHWTRPKAAKPAVAAAVLRKALLLILFSPDISYLLIKTNEQLCSIYPTLKRTQSILFRHITSSLQQSFPSFRPRLQRMGSKLRLSARGLTPSTTYPNI
jgi:hypothetical protein